MICGILNNADIINADGKQNRTQDELNKWAGPGFTPENNDVGFKTTGRHRHARSQQLTPGLGTFTHSWSYRLADRQRAGDPKRTHVQKQGLNEQRWRSRFYSLRSLREFLPNSFSCLSSASDSQEQRENAGRVKVAQRGTFQHSCFLGTPDEQTWACWLPCTLSKGLWNKNRCLWDSL